MTDNESFNKILDYLTDQLDQLTDLELDDDQEYNDYERGMRTAFKKVLTFMGKLMH